MTVTTEALAHLPIIHCRKNDSSNRSTRSLSPIQWQDIDSLTEASEAHLIFIGKIMAIPTEAL